MRSIGSKADYLDRRNKNLVKVYFYNLSGKKNYWSVLRKTVNSPSERFWVSENRALKIIRKMMSGADISSMTKTKKEMFREIYRRVCLMTDKNPSMDLYDIVVSVINQPAPKFYITEKSANVIIHKTLRKWRKERTSKHLPLWRS